MPQAEFHRPYDNTHFYLQEPVLFKHHNGCAPVPTYIYNIEKGHFEVSHTVSDRIYLYARDVSLATIRDLAEDPHLPFGLRYHYREWVTQREARARPPRTQPPPSTARTPRTHRPPPPPPPPPAKRQRTAAPAPQTLPTTCFPGLSAGPGTVIDLD